MDNLKARNTKIVDIGLVYTAHYHSCHFSVYGDSWSIRIPFDRIGEFAETVSPGDDWEDGKFVKDLKGAYIRLLYDGDSLMVKGIQHIIYDDKRYMIGEESH